LDLTDGEGLRPAMRRRKLLVALAGLAVVVAVGVVVLWPGAVDRAPKRAATYMPG
jgi:hypothetical protein